MPRHVLIFGGTFDPPHPAHMALPVHVAERIGADVIIFVPTARNPHKDGPSAASSEQRVAMLEEALAADPPPVPAEVSTIEIDRGGRSWFVETMEAMATAEPDARFTFLIGADNALGFHRWEQWERILELATPAVVLRPPWDAAELRAALEHADAAEDADTWLSRVVTAPLVEMSATDVRERLAGGAAPEGLLAPAVAAYVRKHGLYGLSGTDGGSTVDRGNVADETDARGGEAEAPSAAETTPSPTAPKAAHATHVDQADQADQAEQASTKEAAPPLFHPSHIDPNVPAPGTIRCPRCRQTSVLPTDAAVSRCPHCQLDWSPVPASRDRSLAPWRWAIAPAVLIGGAGLGMLGAYVASQPQSTTLPQILMLLVSASAPLASVVGWFAVRDDLLQASARTRWLVPIAAWILSPALVIPMIGHVVGIGLPMVVMAVLDRRPWAERIATCGRCGYDLRQSAGSCPECSAPCHPVAPRSALAQAPWIIACLASIAGVSAAITARSLDPLRVVAPDGADILSTADRTGMVAATASGLSLLVLLALRHRFVRWPRPVQYAWMGLAIVGVLLAVGGRR